MTTAEALKILSDAENLIAAEARRMDVVLLHVYDDGERVYTARPRRFRTVDAARKVPTTPRIGARINRTVTRLSDASSPR